MEPISPVISSPLSASPSNYASFGRRLAAFLLDGFILFIINSIFAFPMLSTQKASETTYIIIMVSALLQLTVQFGYPIILIGTKGQTLGKMALGIKVVKLDGSKVTIGTALMREVLGKFISGIILGIGYLFPLWDSQKQALHDKVAGTVVVKL